ncbi:MAG: capsular exopolysaccharide synthesis family protein, partial [Flammeovirgaceae bacterium]
MSAAYVYVKRQYSIYTVNTKVLLGNVKDNAIPFQELFTGGSSLSAKNRIDDEMEIIVSYQMLEKTVANLNFLVSYYTEGEWGKITEYYNSLPFLVEIDSSRSQLMANYNLTILSENEFQIDIPKPKDFYSSYNYIDNSYVSNLDITHKGKYKYGDWIEHPNFRFRLIKKGDISSLKDFDRIFFAFNSVQVLANQLKASTSVSYLKQGSSILVINSTGSLPDKNAVFLKELLRVYTDNVLTKKMEVADNALVYIDKQLQSVRDSLDLAEGALERFQVNNKSLDVSTTAQKVFEKVSEIESNKVAINMQRKYYDYLLEYIKKNQNSDIVAPSLVGVGDPRLAGLLQELSELNSQISEKSLMFNGENNMLIQPLVQKLEKIKKTIIETVKSLIVTSNLSLNDVNKRLSTLEAEIRRLPKNEREFINIKRRFNLSDELYTFLLQKRAESGIAKVSTTAGITVVEEAGRAGARKIAPNPSRIYAIAFIIALALPLIFAFFRELSRTKIDTVEELNQITSIPLIGTICENPYDTNLAVTVNPKSIISEMFRGLRVNLSYLKPEKDTKVIAVTSFMSGEGKTFCSMNLAATLAYSGVKTLLIGADLRKPKIFNDFSLQNDVGLSSCLIGEASIEESVKASGFDNLDIILSGPVPPNPVELIENSRMAVMMEKFKETYDYIIIDTAPLGLVSDFFAVKKYSDINLLVVRHRKSKKKALAYIDSLYKNDVISDLN